MKRITKLELISFTTGFALLTFELAAARILAPSVGSSTYVWTGVIGVIIAALSAGFIAGGRLADSRQRPLDVAWLLLIAAGAATLTLATHQAVVDWIVAGVDDSRLQAVLSALILFAPTSFFIGMTSPYLAKLKVTSLHETGRAVASLDMHNAIGGIAGTFTTGFILFGFIGSNETVAFVVLLLILASWLLAPKLHIAKRATISLALVALCGVSLPVSAGKIAIETQDAHYEVIKGYFNAKPVTGLVTGPGGTQSAVYNDGSDELVFWYTQQMAELTIREDPESVLILGGGAFTLPQYLGTRLPNTAIDVVEIDPKLLTISKEYFGYKSPSNVNELFTDARTYVNQSDRQYDVILADVYGDASIPFPLFTKEYGEKIGEMVKEDGIVVANIIGGLKGGPCEELLSALTAAYSTRLPYTLYSNESGKLMKRANHVVVYSKNNRSIEGYQPLPITQAAPYTDNYAPAERLHYGCQHSY